MRFLVSMPGLMRYPPSEFVASPDHWQTRMTPDDYRRVAQTLDQLGFDAVTVSEHLALPVELEPQMGAHFPHAFTAMAFLAGATTQLRVNSMLMVLPYHHPVNLAKAIATLDVLSGGRVTVTFGVGMAPVEFRVLGVPFERRGRVTDEYVKAMKVLWSQDRPAFDGEFVQFDDIVFEPKPVQRPHPPLWFGGRSLRAMRRAMTEGDGWAPSGATLGSGPWFEGPEQLPALLDEIGAARERASKPRPFDVFLSVDQPQLGPNHELLPSTFVPASAQQIMDEVDRLSSLGVTWTMVSRPGANPRTLDEYLDDLRWIAHEVIRPCRSSTPE